MKKMIFAVALLIMLAPQITFAAQCNFKFSHQIGDKLSSKIDECLNKKSFLAFAELEKILQSMRDNKIDMNVVIDSKKNTLLHYVLGGPKINYYMYREVLTLVRRYSYKNDTSLQNEDGYTLPMLAARHNEVGTLLGLFLDTTPVNFAIKNRKDNDKTVIDYAKDQPIIQAICTYDETFKKHIAEKVTETSDLVLDLSRIIAEYATPVNPHDMEADREYEQFMQMTADLKKYVPEFQDAPR